MYIPSRYLNTKNIQPPRPTEHGQEQICPNLESKENVRLLSARQDEMHKSLFENEQRRLDGSLNTSILDNLGRSKRKPVNPFKEYAAIRCIMMNLKSTDPAIQKLAGEYALHLFKGLSRQFVNNPTVKYLKLYCGHQIEIAIKELHGKSPEFTSRQLSECLSKLQLPVLWFGKVYCMRDLSNILEPLDNRLPDMLAAGMNTILGFENIHSIIRKLEQLVTSKPESSRSYNWHQFDELQSSVSKNDYEECLKVARKELFAKKSLENPDIMLALGEKTNSTFAKYILLDTIFSGYNSNDLHESIKACKYLEHFVKNYNNSSVNSVFPVIVKYFTDRLDILSSYSVDFDNTGRPSPFVRELLKWSDIELWFANYLAEDRLNQMKSEQINGIRERMKLLHIDRYEGIPLKQLAMLTDRQRNLCHQILARKPTKNPERHLGSFSFLDKYDDNNNIIRGNNKDNENVTSSGTRSTRKHLLDRSPDNLMGSSNHELDHFSSHRRKLNQDFDKPNEIMDLVFVDESEQRTENERPKNKVFDKNKQNQQQTDSDSDERKSN